MVAMKSIPFLRVLCMFGLATSIPARAADPVFSGPQPGERTTPFRVLEIAGPNAGQERDPVAGNDGKPIALVFVHGLERSLVPLLRVIDRYGAERKDRLKTEVIFLFGDRVAGEQRVKAAAGSLRLQSPVSLSLDGVEGPGNYGLNKDCLMTIVAAKGNVVTTNFALVQPGVADAARVIGGLAATCGDDAPPPVDQLIARSGPDRMARGMAAREPGTVGDGPGELFPGAVPDDPTLNTLIRQIIRPTQDDATVDKLLAEMKAHVQGNAELTRQASNGWVRVLHFGDRYGSAHARKVGREFLDQLKPVAQPQP